MTILEANLVYLEINLYILIDILRIRLEWKCIHYVQYVTKALWKFTSPKLHSHLLCPTACGCRIKTNGATATPNIYRASATLHLYLLHAYNNSADVDTLGATGCGKVLTRHTIFLTGSNEYGATGCSLIQPLFRRHKGQTERALIFRCALFVWWRFAWQRKNGFQYLARSKNRVFHLINPFQTQPQSIEYDIEQH